MDGGSDTVQLWMGAIQPNWNEKYIGDVFRSYGVEVVQTKLIRDKVSNLPLGYAFVEFPNMQIAQAAMDRLNGKEIAGSADTNDDTLATLFKSFFRSVTSVNVVMDSSTGKCKGYGFVRFADSAEMEKALETMSGTLCGSKRIRVNRAAPLKKVDASSSNPITLSTNSTNTTVFCGGLVDVTVDKNALRAHFAHVGEIAGVRIPASRGCGFVEFVRHEDAARAVETMNGSVLGSCTATNVSTQTGGLSAMRVDVVACNRALMRGA
eukprot:g2624.t1